MLNDKFISWRVDSLTSEVLCLSWVSWELYQTRQHAFFTTHQHLIERQCVFGTPHLPCPILKVCVPAGLSYSVSTLYIFTPDFCLKLTFGLALLCQIILSPCIRVTSSPQPRWRNCSDGDGLLNLLKRTQIVIFFLGLSGLLATSQSYSRSTSQQAVCRLHSLSVWCHSCACKESSAAKETRYCHYRKRRLTIVANLQANVSAHSEDQGSSYPFLSPQPPARFRGYKSFNHTANVTAPETCLRSTRLL